jgi:hypothetical protein
MSDSFMRHLRRDPPERLKQELRERLGEASDSAPEDWVPRPRRRVARVLVGVAAAAAAVVAFILSPALRASAQAFLDSFRVRNFVAVKVDPARMEQLKQKNLDLQGLLGAEGSNTGEHAPPERFTDAATAGRAAGCAPRLPSTVPGSLSLDTVMVQQGRQARFTVNGGKLRQVLDALGLSDVRVPPGLDGARVSVRTTPAMVLQYHKESRRILLIEARSPEVSLPSGLEPRELGEIALRIAGLNEGDARRFAGAVDWRNTVLVPVPMNAESFHEVDVHGARGLLIKTEGAPSGTELHGRRGAVLMWSEGEMVYALISNTPYDDLLLMANSL